MSITESHRQEIEEIVDRRVDERVGELASATDSSGVEWSLSDFMDMGLTRRQSLVALGTLAVGGSFLGAFMAASDVVRADDDGSGSIGTSENPLAEIYVDDLFQNQDHIQTESISGDISTQGTIDNLHGEGLIVAGGQLRIDGHVLDDGDGTARSVWVIESEAGDPAGASDNDLIFEKEGD